jgi:hypothetical protein
MLLKKKTVNLEEKFEFKSGRPPISRLQDMADKVDELLILSHGRIPKHLT